MKVIIFMYSFVFACLFTAHATNPVPKPPKVQYPPVVHPSQTNPRDCVKHPLIVKTSTVTSRPSDKTKTIAENKVVKVVPINKGANSAPHFSVLNFINFFYSKDSLDNLHVM